MRHRPGKLKYQHHMIQGLRALLEMIEPWPEITAITPGRIAHTKAAQPGIKLKVQYHTPSGLKCMARAGGAAQEVFIVTSVPADVERKLKAQ